MLRHQTTVLQPIGRLHAVTVKSWAPRGATGSRQRGIRIIMFQCYSENPEDYYNSNGQWASNLGARSGNKWHVLETHHRETWLRGNRLGFIRQILATNEIKVPFLRTDEIIIDNQAEECKATVATYSQGTASKKVSCAAAFQWPLDCNILCG